MPSPEKSSEEIKAGKAVVLDCEEGRRRGCASFCCRLIVRLAPGERDPGQPHRTEKRCVDKHPDSGLCVYMDPETELCTVWDRRPKVCREYDCNEDPLLQIVLRDGFTSLVKLITTPDPAPGEIEAVGVPALGPGGDEG